MLLRLEQGGALLRARLADGSLSRVLAALPWQEQQQQQLEDPRPGSAARLSSNAAQGSLRGAGLASFTAAAALQRGGGHRVRVVVAGLERLLDAPLSAPPPTPLATAATAAVTSAASTRAPPDASLGLLLRSLPQSAAAAARLGQATARLSFELLLAPVALALRGVRGLSQWASAAAAAAAPADGIGDDEGISGYSMQPSAYATAVGDAALRVVQASVAWGLWW